MLGIYMIQGESCEVQGNEVGGVKKIHWITVKYETKFGTGFEMYGGDLTEKLEITRVNLTYAHRWLTDKLRKLESGEIKVINRSSKERDWKQEEKIKRQMWEDIEINEYPEGIAVHPYGQTICTQELQTGPR